MGRGAFAIALIAALGQRTKAGASRKPDHDKVNEILDAAYEPGSPGIGPQVADQIHRYAGGWARMIANPIQIPGYRAQRDASCKAALQSQL